jgi:hypothetical protein
MVDKIKSKEYVANLIGREYVIPTIWEGEKFDDIDFSELPNEFVIKCNHDSGGLVICKDKTKLNMEAAKAKIERCLNRNYYQHNREWAYKYVKPKILIEKYLECGDGNQTSLNDYKIYCFNGRAKYCQVIQNRYSNETIDFYDVNWEKQEFTGLHTPHPPHAPYTPQPLGYKKMIEFAEILSQGTKFLRVDFYDINGKVYFGEMTFFPAGGFGCFEPKEWNVKLGELIQL